MGLNIRLGGIIIREYKRSDLNAVHMMLSDPNIYSTTCAIPRECDRSYASMWLDSVRRSVKKGFDLEYGVFDAYSGDLIGNIGLIDISYPHKSGEITYIIRSPYQRRGYALLSSRLIISYGFERLGLMRIHGRCMDFNTASRYVMLKCGFVYEGTGRGEMIKDGRQVNLEHYSLLRSEYDALRDKIFYPKAIFPNF